MSANLFDLTGQVALVTGTSRGLGQYFARALARAGADLILTSRDRATLAPFEQEIAALGRRTVSVSLDVTDQDSITQAVAEAEAAFGRIDILVNNAQQVPLGPVLGVTDEAFLTGFTSGPLATFRLMKLCHPHLVARGGGSIINFATAAAERWDMSNYGAYGAVKNAIRVLSRAAACEWGKENIRVNTIAPHALSPGMEGWIKAVPEEAAAFIATIPLGRLGDCEHDIGDFIVQLCGPAMGYLTGSTIPLDGGQANFG